MPRDAEMTKQKILQALAAVLARQGFSRVGVNAVAREAGVDKVLIYRYFGGLPGLVEEFAKGDWWPRLEQPAGAARMADVGELSLAILKNHLRSLREKPLTQEIMRWELAERNELTDALARAREEEGLDLLALEPLKNPPRPDMDIPAVAAILHAGLTYLVLRAKTADAYLGLDLSPHGDWDRVEKALTDLVRSYFNRPVSRGLETEMETDHE